MTKIQMTTPLVEMAVSYTHLCGMAPEFLAHVFEPFAREHDSRTESVEGTGLGLSLIHI